MLLFRPSKSLSLTRHYLQLSTARRFPTLNNFQAPNRSIDPGSKVTPSANMPQMIISRNSRVGKDSINSDTMGTFTGTVWVDPVLAGEGMSVANVNFPPCARTNWHFHSGGQLLRVLAGAGWVCDKGGEPQRIMVGDVIWCPPGTTHWHGADDGSYMVHQAVSHGQVEWYGPVTDEEYGKKEKE